MNFWQKLLEWLQPKKKVAEHPHARAYALAKAELGTAEISGRKHNSKIVGWFKLVGHEWVKDDETAWCAAFAGAMLQLGGLPSTRALNARSYLNWGKKVPLAEAQIGDIVVFERGNSTWQGHVGFFAGREKGNILVLGGNQKNKVGLDKYSEGALLGVRRWQG